MNSLTPGTYYLIFAASFILLGLLFFIIRLKKAHAKDIELRTSQLQRELQESQEMLRDAQKLEALGRMTGGVAHDFNNLVTVISCNVSLLQQSLQDNNPLQEELLQIKDATDRATSLTKQLLGFSRRQYESEVSTKPIHINDMVISLKRVLSSMVGTQIEIQTSLGTDIGFFRADPVQIEQVIMNLAVNARDAMPQGGKLTLKTDRKIVSPIGDSPNMPIPNGDYVTLTVLDNGVGMPSTVMERAFEPFYTTKDGQGTGLGLATIKTIINDIGGHITVDSSTDFGTRFVLYFQTVKVAETALSAPNSSHLLQSEATQQTH